MKKNIRNLFLLFKQYLKACNRSRKPCFIKVRSALLVFFIVVFIEFLFIANFVGRISLEHFFASIVPEALVELTNVRRSDEEVGELRVSSLLAKAAQKKADDMASKGYFAHTSPEGITPWYWFDFVGYSYRYAGENLAVNFQEAHEVDKAWMKSPKHRDNIVNEKFEEIGIATAEGEYKGKEAVFVVQLFGTRMEVRPVVVEEPVEIVLRITDNEEEGVLGEEMEQEEVAAVVDEKIVEPLEEVEELRQVQEEDIQGEESFALIGKWEEKPFLVVGKPDKVIKEQVGDLEYPSFWGRIVSSPGRSLGYLLLVMATIFCFSLILKLLLMRRVYLTFMIVNEVLILLIVFSALVTSHYVLLFGRIL